MRADLQSKLCAGIERHTFMGPCDSATLRLCDTATLRHCDTACCARQPHTPHTPHTAPHDTESVETATPTAAGQSYLRPRRPVNFSRPSVGVSVSVSDRASMSVERSSASEPFRDDVLPPLDVQPDPEETWPLPASTAPPPPRAGPAPTTDPGTADGAGPAGGTRGGRAAAWVAAWWVWCAPYKAKRGRMRRARGVGRG